ncbi:MAG: hypothetical protein AB7P76_02740 [Candidatus Melainabacteria bacterium]
MSTIIPGTTAPAAPPALVAAPAPAAIPAAAPAAPQLFGQKAEIGTDEVSLSVKADKTAKGKAKSAAGKVGAFAKSTAGKVIGASAAVAAVAAAVVGVSKSDAYQNRGRIRNIEMAHDLAYAGNARFNEAYDQAWDEAKAENTRRDNAAKQAAGNIEVTPVTEETASAPVKPPTDAGI